MTDVLDQMLREIEQPTVKRRGFLVPRDEMSDGTTQWAWPSAVADPYEAVQRILRGELPVMHPDEMTNADAAERLGAGLTAASLPMGGSAAIARPAASLGAGGVLPREVISWLQRAGVPIEKIQTASTGSTYVHARDPNAAKGAPGSRVEVRIPPEDGHGGRILPKDVKPGNYFDTTPEAPRKQFDRIMSPRVNQGGEQYSDREALFDALKWRFQRSPDGQPLVSPDRAPRGLTPEPAAKPLPELSPDQLKLLATAEPAQLVEILRQILGDD
jgi:hypothetical protein